MRAGRTVILHRGAHSRRRMRGVRSRHGGLCRALNPVFQWELAGPTELGHVVCYQRSLGSNGCYGQVIRADRAAQFASRQYVTAPLQGYLRRTSELALRQMTRYLWRRKAFRTGVAMNPQSIHLTDAKRTWTKRPARALPPASASAVFLRLCRVKSAALRFTLDCRCNDSLGQTPCNNRPNRLCSNRGHFGLQR